MLRLIRMWLRAGVMEDGLRRSTSTGVPQGGVISPLLANIYGHALDALFEKEAGHLGKMVRWADDLVILCRTKSDAQQVYRWLENRAKALRLTLHPDKSRIVALNGGDEGFDFLGFHHRMVKSWRTGHRYCQRWPSVRAMAAIRAKVRAISAPRARLKWPVPKMVGELNPVLRGMGELLSLGQLGEEVRPDRELRHPEAGALR